MATRLILIRHGQTAWSVKKKYCGHSDVELDETGIRQAERLREKLRSFHSEKVVQVYSSDSKRAKNFAEIVFRGMSVRTLSALREMNFGIFEGLTYREIMRKYPGIYSRWLSNLSGIPGGEGLNEFQKRVKNAIARIISLNQNKTVALVTHSGPIRVIIKDVLNLKDIWGIKTDLACVYIIEFGKKKAIVKLLNG